MIEHLIRYELTVLSAFANIRKRLQHPILGPAVGMHRHAPTLKMVQQTMYYIQPLGLVKVTTGTYI